MMGAFPKVGDLIDNRYLIEQVIGKGGFSSVFKAIQLNLKRPVAIKVMVSAEYVDNVESGEMTERFRREAVLVASLQNPFTIRLFDFGITQTGYLFMVFEYVKGIDLADLVERHGRQSQTRTVQVLTATLSCLHEAHTLGILHRDIKPGNIMLYDYLDYHDLVKVLDFGIAKPVSSDWDRGDQLTAAGTMIGTPRYMAPELIRGSDPTPMSDIYSLGLVAYEMLVGSKAIEGEDQMQIITDQISNDSFHLPEDLSDVEPRLMEIINQMLEKSRHKRYSNVQQILHDLRALNFAPSMNEMTPWLSSGGRRTGPALEPVVDGFQTRRIGPDDVTHQGEMVFPDFVAPDGNPTQLTRNAGTHGGALGSASRTWGYVVVIVLMLAIIAGAAYYIFLHDGGLSGGGNVEHFGEESEVIVGEQVEP